MKLNAYKKKDGRIYIVINSDNGETIFINKEFLDYAIEHAKEPKEKK